jgi:hypothetical protein
MPTGAGEITIEVRAGVGTVLASMPVHVSPVGK